MPGLKVREWIGFGVYGALLDSVPVVPEFFFLFSLFSYFFSVGALTTKNGDDNQSWVIFYSRSNYDSVASRNTC